MRRPLDVIFSHVFQPQTSQSAVWIRQIPASAVDAKESLAVEDVVRLFELLGQITGRRVPYYIMCVAEIVISFHSAPYHIEELGGGSPVNQSPHRAVNLDGLHCWPLVAIPKDLSSLSSGAAVKQIAASLASSVCRPHSASLWERVFAQRAEHHILVIAENKVNVTLIDDFEKDFYALGSPVDYVADDVKLVVRAEVDKVEHRVITVNLAVDVGHNVC